MKKNSRYCSIRSRGKISFGSSFFNTHACYQQLLTILTTWDILPAVGVPASIGLPKPALAEMVFQITFLLKEFAKVNPGRPQSSY